MFVRHAEKPGDHGAPHGVDHDGQHDPHSLAVRGWTRAGALAGLLCRVPTAAQPQLVVPQRVFATKSSHNYQSEREVATAMPLAHRLGLKVDDKFSHGDETKLRDTVLASAEPALVVWHHGSMGDLLRAFPLADVSSVPHSWPEDRFDVIWVLQRTGDMYTFESVNQSLLAGDE